MQMAHNSVISGLSVRPCVVGFWLMVSRCGWAISRSWGKIAQKAPFRSALSLKSGLFCT